jgi:FkbM family methyltransferase
MVRDISLRTVVFHLVGQPWVHRNKKVQSFLWKLFFGNRILPAIGRYNFFGQGEIDRILKEKLGRDGFFVEVGSNDGLSFSNCKHLELYCNWRGILIEPYQPNLELSKVHRTKLNSFVHAALVTSEYIDTSVELIYSNLMTTLAAPSEEVLDPEAHAELGRQFLAPGQEIRRFHAPARKLAEILQEENAPKVIDLLSIDIEGHDLEVLRDFDWSFDFRFLLVEALDSQTMIAFLESKGFQLIFRDPFYNLLFEKTSIIEAK